MNNECLEVRKLISCSTHLSMDFILLINVKMPTIGILTLMSRINCQHFNIYEQDASCTAALCMKLSLILNILMLMSCLNFMCS